MWSLPLPLLLRRINNLATVDSPEQAKQRTYTQQQLNKGLAGRTSTLYPVAGRRSVLCLTVLAAAIGADILPKARSEVCRAGRDARAPPKLYGASTRRKVTEGHGRPRRPLPVNSVGTWTSFTAST